MLVLTFIIVNVFINIQVSSVEHSLLLDIKTDQTHLNNKIGT